MDTAMPLGLIVNELITNSLKDAVPDGRRTPATQPRIEGNVDFCLYKNRPKST
jgi:two-component sensor histidine kinase